MFLWSLLFCDVYQQTTMRELQWTRQEGNAPQKQINELSIWTQHAFP